MSPTWEPVKGQLQEEELKVEVVPPQGWYRFRDSSDDIIFTKHGLELQHIRVSKRLLVDLNEDTKKKLSAKMLPHEVANWVNDGFLANPSFMNQHVLKVRLANIVGRSGYRLLLSFKTTEGLTYRVLQYGYLDKETLVQLSYVAVSRAYFDQAVSTFEQVVASFQEMQETPET
ncbi:hypothetical protein [Nitrospira sp. M1]